jgi:hypothetical protein
MHTLNSCITSIPKAHQRDPVVSDLAAVVALELVRHIHPDLLDIAGHHPAVRSYNLAEREADLVVVAVAASLAAAVENRYSGGQIEDFGAVEPGAGTVVAGRTGWKSACWSIAVGP